MACVKRTEHCLCGSSLTIQATSQAGLDKAFSLWREHHAGDGHGPANRKQAYAVRMRSDLADAERRHHGDHFDQL